jgi:ketosteroid isomerase-like protein
MKLCLALFAVGCMAVLAAAQESDRDAGIATTIRTLETSRFDAQQKKDVGALNSIFGDALMLVDENGTLWTKADFLANSRSSNIVLLRIVPESLTVRVNGDVAIVIGIYKEKELKAARPHAQRCRFIDTWAFEDGKWLCIASAAAFAIS